MEFTTTCQKARMEPQKLILAEARVFGPLVQSGRMSLGELMLV